MPDEMFTELPQVQTADLTDIICAVQGYVNGESLGVSVQESLQQIYNLFAQNLIQGYAGNPNGHVAGNTYGLLWDTLHNIAWVCTTTGTADTAVWTKLIGALLNQNFVGNYTVSRTAGQAKYTSIQSAIDAAVANGANAAQPATVWVFEGTYTENLTLHPYVNLSSACFSQTSSVVVIGNATYASAGNFAVNFITFKSTNSTATLAFNASGASVIDLFGCNFLTASTGYAISSVSANNTVRIYSSFFDAATTGLLFNVSAGTVVVNSTTLNNGNKAVGSLVSGGSLLFNNSLIQDRFTITDGSLELSSCVISGQTTLFTLTTPATVILSDVVVICSDLSGYFVTGTGTLAYGIINCLANAFKVNSTITLVSGVSLLNNLSFDGGNTFMSANGQIWIYNATTQTPTPATLTAGSNIAITNAAGSVTISATGLAGIGWNVVTATTQSMTADSGYIANNAALVSLTLPTTAAVGTLLYVQGLGAGGWEITQNAGQIVHLGSEPTTAGTAGSLASTNRYDSITLVCVVANTAWTALNAPQGTITVT